MKKRVQSNQSAIFLNVRLHVSIGYIFAIMIVDVGGNDDNKERE